MSLRRTRVRKSMTLPEAKAPDPIRQLCQEIACELCGSRWCGIEDHSDSCRKAGDKLLIFAMQQRAAARAEVFEEARQIALSIDSNRGNEKEIARALRRAAQEANHDQ